MTPTLVALHDAASQIGPTLPPKALRLYLATLDEVKAVQISPPRDDAIKFFVESLLQDLKTGVLFPHDVTLAALAVALQGNDSPCAKEYLVGLSEIYAAELPYSTRIAREILLYDD